MSINLSLHLQPFWGGGMGGRPIKCWKDALACMVGCGCLCGYVQSGLCVYDGGGGGSLEVG